MDLFSSTEMHTAADTRLLSSALAQGAISALKNERRRGPRLRSMVLVTLYSTTDATEDPCDPVASFQRLVIETIDAVEAHAAAAEQSSLRSTTYSCVVNAACIRDALDLTSSMADWTPLLDAAGASQPTAALSVCGVGENPFLVAGASSYLVESQLYPEHSHHDRPSPVPEVSVFVPRVTLLGGRGGVTGGDSFAAAELLLHAVEAFNTLQRADAASVASHPQHDGREHGASCQHVFEPAIVVELSIGRLRAYSAAETHTPPTAAYSHVTVTMVFTAMQSPIAALLRHVGEVQQHPDTRGPGIAELPIPLPRSSLAWHIATQLHEAVVSKTCSFTVASLGEEAASPSWLELLHDSLHPTHQSDDLTTRPPKRHGVTTPALLDALADVLGHSIGRPHLIDHDKQTDLPVELPSSLTPGGVGPPLRVPRDRVLSGDANLMLVLADAAALRGVMPLIERCVWMRRFLASHGKGGASREGRSRSTTMGDDSMIRSLRRSLLRSREVDMLQAWASAVAAQTTVSSLKSHERKPNGSDEEQEARPLRCAPTPTRRDRPVSSGELDHSWLSSVVAARSPGVALDTDAGCSIFVPVPTPSPRRPAYQLQHCDDDPSLLDHAEQDQLHTATTRLFAPDAPVPPPQQRGLYSSRNTLLRVSTVATQTTSHAIGTALIPTTVIGANSILGQPVADDVDAATAGGQPSTVGSSHCAAVDKPRDAQQLINGLHGASGSDVKGAESFPPHETAAADMEIVAQKARDERDLAIARCDTLRLSIESLQSQLATWRLAAEAAIEARDAARAELKSLQAKASPTPPQHTVGTNTRHRSSREASTSMVDNPPSSALSNSNRHHRDALCGPTTPRPTLTSSGTWTDVAEVADWRLLTIEQVTSASQQHQQRADIASGPTVPIPTLTSSGTSTDELLHEDELSELRRRVRAADVTVSALQEELSATGRDKVNLVLSLRDMGAALADAELRASQAAQVDDINAQLARVTQENADLQRWIAALRQEGGKLVTALQSSERERVNVSNLKETICALGLFNSADSNGVTSSPPSQQRRAKKTNGDKTTVSSSPSGAVSLSSANPTVTGQLSDVTPIEQHHFGGFFNPQATPRKALPTTVSPHVGSATKAARYGSPPSPPPRRREKRA